MIRTDEPVAKSLLNGYSIFALVLASRVIAEIEAFSYPHYYSQPQPKRCYWHNGNFNFDLHFK